jgi:hypothetical protein
MKKAKGLGRMAYADGVYEVEIGLYELGRYVAARERYERLITDQEEVFDSLYDDISPSITEFDLQLERISFRGVHTETKALEIIEAKELYAALIKKEKRKADMYEAALKTLTHLELKVIQIKYHNQIDDRSLYGDLKDQLLSAAERKLCNYLETILKQRIKLMQKEKRNRLKEQMQAGLKGNANVYR